VQGSFVGWPSVCEGLRFLRMTALREHEPRRSRLHFEAHVYIA
jgi:hypothetical protein